MSDDERPRKTEATGDNICLQGETTMTALGSATNATEQPDLQNMGNTVPPCHFGNGVVGG